MIHKRTRELKEQENPNTKPKKKRKTATKLGERLI
jgi:hypothetical protein